MAELHETCRAPGEAREDTYRLLSQKSPTCVLIDTDLAPGAWYVVRYAYEHEKKDLARIERRKAKMKGAA